MRRGPNIPNWHDDGFPLGPADHVWRIKIPQFKLIIERVVADSPETKKWKEDNA